MGHAVVTEMRMGKCNALLLEVLFKRKVAKLEDESLLMTAYQI